MSFVKIERHYLFCLQDWQRCRFAFLIALRGKTQDYAIIWSTILVLYAVVCYFAVFIFAITNYYRGN
ncbi:MAG: hypothetical protein ACLTRS_03790 [Lachnospiraceae bacterium]